MIISILGGIYALRQWWMASDKPAERLADGSILLRYSRNTFWLGLISLLIGGLIIGIGLSFGDSIETWFSMLLTGVAFLLVGFWLMVEYFGSRVITNQRYIRRRSWLGSDLIVDWARVETVTFAPRSGHFVVRGTQGEKIRVNRMMRGFKEFKEILETQVPDERFDRTSMKDYEKLERIEQELFKELEKD